MEALRGFLDTPGFPLAWAATSVVCLGVLGWDLARNNRALGGLMKLVWILTVAYSGILGLVVYWHAGRSQIPRDTVWRKGFRSTAHCYSGCGMGEVVGVLISAGLFAMGNLGTGLITFALAYTFGIGLTVGPLLQDGESLASAMKDAFISESASIVVMEAVAIAVDLLLARNATMSQPIFWSSLLVSLTLGLVAAYPVNVLLIHEGVKEGMHDPREANAH